MLCYGNERIVDLSIQIMERLLVGFMRHDVAELTYLVHVSKTEHFIDLNISGAVMGLKIIIYFLLSVKDIG